MRSLLWLAAGACVGYALVLAVENVRDDRAREAEAADARDRDCDPEYVEDFELYEQCPALWQELQDLPALTEAEEREVAKHLTPLPDLLRAREVATDADSLANEAYDYLARWDRGEKP